MMGTRSRSSGRAPATQEWLQEWLENGVGHADRSRCRSLPGAMELADRSPEDHQHLPELGGTLVERVKRRRPKHGVAGALIERVGACSGEGGDGRDGAPHLRPAIARSKAAGGGGGRVWSVKKNGLLAADGRSGALDFSRICRAFRLGRSGWCSLVHVGLLARGALWPETVISITRRAFANHGSRDAQLPGGGRVRVWVRGAAEGGGNFCGTRTSAGRRGRADPGEIRKSRQRCTPALVTSPTARARRSTRNIILSRREQKHPLPTPPATPCPAAGWTWSRRAAAGWWRGPA